MAEIIKEELNIEEFKIKEEKVSIKDEIPSSSPIEDTHTCTVNLHKDDLKTKNTEIQGKLKNILLTKYRIPDFPSSAKSVLNLIVFRIF